MLFDRIEVPGLAHYSYVVGCPADGRMIVVDPKRDVADYIQMAASRSMHISHVLETHIHADFASGARELAEQTGAELCVSAYDQGETFAAQFRHRDLADGAAVKVGSVRVVAVHTPGHTPEHISFLVYDLLRSAETPMLFLTGDFLFVGSLGRPDLLGEEQKRDLARQMFQSVRRKLKNLPDGLEIHPAHGAGSLCGAGLSGRAMSTLGFERIANPYLDSSLTETEFVTRLLTDVPPFPPYYRRMKQLNSIGAPTLGERHLSPLDVEAFEAGIAGGAVVIDLRDQIAFGGGHIPHSFGIGAGSLLPVWASWVIPYETTILLIARDQQEADEAAVMLSRVGLDGANGWLSGGMIAWRDARKTLEILPQLSPAEAAEQLESRSDVTVLDVRTDAEWDAGHINGAIHSFAGTLLDNLDRLPESTAPILVTCGGGYRSTVACSVLRQHGFNNVINLTGGMRAWNKAGLPTVRTERPLLAGAQ